MCCKPLASGPAQAGFGAFLRLKGDSEAKSREQRSVHRTETQALHQMMTVGGHLGCPFICLLYRNKPNERMPPSE
jgi:hypothetical protein